MKKRIVIIGGGFAGLNLAKNIDSKKYHITLVDKNNYTFFPPLLYQVATGFLEPTTISYPYRKMFQKKPNLHFKMGEFLEIIPSENKVMLSSGELEYDYVVFATGTVTNYFGMENVQKNAIPMKTINDALDMRNYILEQLERATTFTSDKEKLKKTLNIVVAGGGPTGVEVSGMLAEMQFSIFLKDYPEFVNAHLESRIYLVDGGSQLLSPMSEKSQKATYIALKKLGVEIMLNSRVTDYVDGKVLLSDGRVIETENLIWTAGVTAQSFKGIPQECYGRGGRLLVDAHHKLENMENVYAIGDTCIQTADPAFPEGHPQVAQVALQQGKNLANNFMRMLHNKPQKTFKYKDKGSMAIIGRNKAVADLSRKLHFKGFIAWLIWIFIHLISLMHYRNKVRTFLNWVTSYFTRDQALRMIIRPKE